MSKPDATVWKPCAQNDYVYKTMEKATKKATKTQKLRERKDFNITHGKKVMNFQFWEHRKKTVN